MSHLFISYKSQEHHLAQQVRNQLQGWGYTTWLDQDNLVVKDNWMTEIDVAIRSADAVIAIMTPSALASRYVIGEWDLAIVNSVPFIPLEFETTPQAHKYHNIRKFDLTKDQPKALADFRQYLHELYQNNQQPIVQNG